MKGGMDLPFLPPPVIFQLLQTKQGQGARARYSYPNHFCSQIVASSSKIKEVQIAYPPSFFQAQHQWRNSCSLALSFCIYLREEKVQESLSFDSLKHILSLVAH